MWGLDSFTTFYHFLPLFYIKSLITLTGLKETLERWIGGITITISVYWYIFALLPILYKGLLVLLGISWFGSLYMGLNFIWSL